jgi:hypothetical protein
LLSFVYDKSSGDASSPSSLQETMAAARKRLPLLGKGPYAVNWDEHRHPDLSRYRALKVLHAVLEHMKVGDTVRVQGASGVLFLASRVEVTTYRDPFRFAHISPARIDAGVDLCGEGKVTALGPAVILRRGTPSHTSTFGSDLSAYRLTEGPGKGLVVFFAEHYNLAPKIAAGQNVDAETPLYYMNGCIEIGWATDSGAGSKAWSETPYSEGQRSALGDNMNELLGALGCVSGLTRGRRTT